MLTTYSTTLPTTPPAYPRLASEHHDPSKMGDPQFLKYPILPLAQSVFGLASPYSDHQTKQASRQALQDAIKEHKMAPLYAYLAHPQTGKLNTSGESGSKSPTLSRANTNASAPSPANLLRRTSSINAPSMLGVLGGNTDNSVELPWDEAKYNELKAENEKELEAIQKEEDDARENAGDVEVHNAQGKRAEYYAKIGDKDKALDEFEKLFEKTSILGTKIDIVLAILRIGLFFDDKLLVKKNIDRCQTLVESGGDWDRRNRLKAYTGLHLLTIRSYNLAAAPLLDSLSTFTSTELCPYSSLVVYATLAGAIALPRREFKSKVVDAPEIRAVFGSASNEDRLSALGGAASAGMGADDSMETDSAPAKKDATTTPKPTVVNLTTLGTSSSTATEEPVIDFKPLASMVSSLYAGQYNTFFQSLATVETDFLAQDRFLFEHKNWYVREMRLRAYQQLLSSYRVVSLESMAKSFGVTVAWLDKDLAPFIASGRLSCSIDRVKGVIETRREDGKGGQ